MLPELDANVCSKWTQVQRDFYNALPVYFAKFNSEYRKRWDRWQKLVPKRFKWEPNMGDTMRRITQERSPIMRQEAHPNLLTDVPKTDMYVTRERSHEVKIYRHRFQSRDFHFYPEFNDFNQHVEYEKEDLQRQIHIYTELFIRTRVFHLAPFVYVAGHGLIAAPSGIPNAAGTAAKSDDWLESEVFAKNPGVLDLKQVFKLLNVADVEIGMTPYEGSGTPSGDSKPLDERYALVLPPETWNQFTDDSFLKENRRINLDIVTDVFRGDLFGRVRCMLEFNPYRYLKAADGTITRPQPEITADGGPDVEKYRTRPNPKAAKDSQYTVSFLVGGNFGAMMDVGAPPSLFTKDMQGALGMNWNGKINLNKNFLTQCLDEAGNPQLDTNSWGEYLRLQAQLALGYAPDNAFNVLPIIHARQVGITTTGV